MVLQTHDASGKTVEITECVFPLCFFFGVKAMEWARPFCFGYYFITYSAPCFLDVLNYLFMKLLCRRWIVSVKAEHHSTLTEKKHFSDCVKFVTLKCHCSNQPVSFEYEDI